VVVVVVVGVDVVVLVKNIVSSVFIDLSSITIPMRL